MKTYSLKPQDITRKWHVIDASQIPLGRLSTVAARLLIGKDKPSQSPHIDGGDFVIIINAASLVVTGKKRTDKIYYRHSGFPGGLYQRTLDEQMNIDSTKVIEHSIRGMLPVNKLRDGRLKRLKIYKDGEHNHHAQKPKTLDLKKGDR